MKTTKIFIWLVIITFATTFTALSQTTDPQTVTLKVKGLHCPNDVKTISESITKLNGVTRCSAGKPGATTTFTVLFNPALVSEKDIRSAVENTGGCDNPETKPYKVKK